MSEDLTVTEYTWKCLKCGAVCNSSPDVIPVPCDYCDSEEVVRYADAPDDAPDDVVHDGDA